MFAIFTIALCFMFTKGHSSSATKQLDTVFTGSVNGVFNTISAAMGPDDEKRRVANLQIQWQPSSIIRQNIYPFNVEPDRFTPYSSPYQTLGELMSDVESRIVNTADGVIETLEAFNKDEKAEQRIQQDGNDNKDGFSSSFRAAQQQWINRNHVTYNGKESEGIIQEFPLQHLEVTGRMAVLSPTLTTLLQSTNNVSMPSTVWSSKSSKSTVGSSSIPATTSTTDASLQSKINEINNRSSKRRCPSNNVFGTSTYDNSFVLEVYSSDGGGWFDGSCESCRTVCSETDGCLSYAHYASLLAGKSQCVLLSCAWQ